MVIHESRDKRLPHSLDGAVGGLKDGSVWAALLRWVSHS